MEIGRQPLPRVETLDDARKALVELTDKVNQLIEEIKRLRQLIEPLA